MNRIDELTIQSIDGELTADEQRELDALLADESARDRYVALLDVESTLRSLGPAPVVASEMVEQIQKDASFDLERSVMREIAAMPAKDEKSASRVRQLSWLLLGASVFTACLVFMAISAGLRGPDDVDNSEPVPSGLAVLVDKSADVRLISADGKTQLPVIGKSIPAGKVVTTTRDGWAVLQLADGSRLNLYSNSRLKLEAGEQVGLLTGSLRAEVKSPQKARRFVIRTPHARVRVGETRVTLTSLEDQGTRIDLDSGTAELDRADRKPMSLAAGSTAFVPSGQQPVIVKARSSALSEPSRETAFRGLRRLSNTHFNGTAFAVSHWQAVFWHPEDDRVEALPMSKQGRRGVRMERLGGPAVAVRESSHRSRLLLWDARTRKPIRSIRTRSRQELAAAISATGDWVALLDPKKGKRKSFRLVFTKDRKRKTVRFTGKQIISAMASSPNGRWLAVGRRRIGHSKGNAIDLIDCQSGKRVGRLDVKFSHPIAIGFSADNKRLAVGLTGRVQVWDVEQQTMIAQIEQLGSPILHVALSPDGQTLAGAGMGDRVWVWDVATRTERCVILPGEQSRGVTFIADDTLIILTKDGRLTEWKLPTEKTSL